MPYDLKSVKLPRLKGGMLSLVASLLEHSLTGPLLAGPLLRDAGIGALRRFPSDDAPTWLPRLPFDGPAATATDAPDLASLSARTADWPRPEGLALVTIADYAAAYRAGTTTPLAVAERVLDAITESDRAAPPLRAFISVLRDEVLAQARASTERLATGRALGVLDGVPIAVKDEMDQSGHPTSVGTRIFGTKAALEDAGAVAGLRAAGALLVGKANMQEIGLGVFGLNPHHGIARNPHNPLYHTGGSSSGSAAAVGAGIVPVAVGADGGGSIRVPAGFCGVVGLKPTFGRVSERGAAPLCWSVAFIGPIGATARDVLLAYAAMAGPDGRDPGSLLQPPMRFDDLERDDLRGITLGVYRPWFAHATAEIVAACDAQLAAFVRRGATVRDVELPELEPARMAHLVTITSEMVASMNRETAGVRARFGDETRLGLALASYFTAADYVQAQRIRTRAMAHAARALEQVDAIITPATAITAPAVAPGTARGVSDVTATTEIMRFAFLQNFTGHPAISFPVGYGAHGLPIAMQAMGRPWREDVLLRLAAAAERDVARRAPAVRFAPLGG